VDASASYTFDCGEFGGGFVDIVNGKMNFSCQLAGMRALTSDPAVGYHLHTIWDQADNLALNDPDAIFATGSSCGSDYTGLHYDPTNKCGPASEGLFLGKCGDKSATYACGTDDLQRCERGDLSGKYGAIVLDGDGAGSKSFVGDNFQAMPSDFVENNTLRDDKLFSSIVFHQSSNGGRVLCCKLTPTYAAVAAVPVHPVTPPLDPDSAEVTPKTNNGNGVPHGTNNGNGPQVVEDNKASNGNGKAKGKDKTL
jgi:hypothetical protein